MWKEKLNKEKFHWLTQAMSKIHLDSHPLLRGDQKSNAFFCAFSKSCQGFRRHSEDSSLDEMKRRMKCNEVMLSKWANTLDTNRRDCKTKPPKRYSIAEIFKKNSRKVHSCTDLYSYTNKKSTK